MNIAFLRRPGRIGTLAGVVLALGLACTVPSTGLPPAGGGGGTGGTPPTGGTPVPIGTGGQPGTGGTPSMKKSNGETCEAGAECGTGFCVDGHCCDGLCAMPCFSCALPDNLGSCAPIPPGGMPIQAKGAQCRQEDARTCGLDGTCDGMGGCRQWIAGTACSGRTCTDDVETPPSTCNGRGLCEPSEPMGCTPFRCGVNACLDMCRKDEDCQAGMSCLSQKCQVADAPAVRFTVSLPTIDGQLDAVWSKAAELPMNKVVSGRVDNAQDLQATFRLLWSSEALYVFAQVRDSNLSNDSSEIWQDDSIELFLDVDNSRSADYDGKDDVQYLFGWNDTAFQESKLNKKAGVLFASRTNPANDGYAIEIAVPWALWGVTADNGRRIGFEIAVNDDDFGGGRDAKLNYFGTRDEAYRRPAAFGQILLGGP